MTFVLSLFLWVFLAAQEPAAGYQIGEVVTDFSLGNVDGQSVTLSAYAKRGVIVIFDCNTCPYSKAYNDRIMALHAEFSGRGFPVLAINPNHGPGDRFDDNVARASDRAYAFPYLHDESQAVARAFGATNTPHVFLLERNGNDLILIYSGAIDDNARDAMHVNQKWVVRAIEARLRNENVPTSRTKAIGCGIKWKES